ncbi:hypothetical protein Pla52n_27330 [Stieleria varia]|uniref:Uncharacterized protein n=1 Tax=Stieleria varia TaxID=2528005 RepID=A0A5C6AZ42_9BACT|nr:hypothetical protein Pla52n_27330 [Stieleria varia]
MGIASSINGEVDSGTQPLRWGFWRIPLPDATGAGALPLPGWHSVQPAQCSTGTVFNRHSVQPAQCSTGTVSDQLCVSLALPRDAFAAGWLDQFVL